MKCNTPKCKEIIFERRTILLITLLGVTFQSNCLFRVNEANKCLYIIRELKKEGYSQDEIDHLFKAIVLPKIMYGLPVYGACQAILNTAQCFLERCFKRCYPSKLYNINELLEKCDRKLFNKISSNSSHPLYPMLPQAKVDSFVSLVLRTWLRLLHKSFRWYVTGTIACEPCKKNYADYLICCILLLQSLRFSFPSTNFMLYCKYAFLKAVKMAWTQDSCHKHINCDHLNIGNT